MMIHAYNESYLADAKNSLAGMFHYAINDCKIESDWFAKLFLVSGLADKFELGNPSVLSGMSGIELAKTILVRVGCEDQIAIPVFAQDRSPEYWSGFALAEYQWYTGKRFRDIFLRISLSQIIGMYSIYHEMDIRQFIEAMNKAYDLVLFDTNLKQIRESRNISQIDLAKMSGVNLRSIQMYEQKNNDIDKAQSNTLYKLSRVLGCKIEDLLENPIKR